MYSIVDTVLCTSGQATKTLPLIRVPLDNGKFHVMLIKDVSKLAVLRICPHCREFVFDSKKDLKIVIDLLNT